jgi:hypothetical protein
VTPIFAVEVGDLFQVIWVAAVSGIGITVLYSLVLLGWARAAEARRTGHAARATVAAGLAGVAFVVFAVSVALGVKIMLTK